LLFRVRGVLGVIVTVASLLATARPADAVTALDGFHSAYVGQDPWPVISAGTTTTYTLRFRNTGTETWRRGVAGRQVNLGVVNDSLAFGELAAGWMSQNRTATTVETTVAPGAVGTFTFSLRAPQVLGVYDIPLRPVVDGVTWLEHQGVFVRVVSDAGWHSRWIGQSPNPSLAPGTTSADLTVTFRNTGTKTWTRGVVGQQALLGIKNDDRTWSSLAVSWPDAARPAVQNEPTVPPGADATFTFKVKAPQTPSTYVLALRPVIDGVTWLEDQGVFVSVTVNGGVTPNLSTSLVQAGMDHPWDLAFAPDGRMFVTERVGNLLVYQSGMPGAVQVANTAITGVRAEGEAGLMSLEFDPAFAANSYLYICASRMDEGQWRDQVLRYRVVGDTVAFDGYVIRRGMIAAASRSACRIRFGPDGKLWVTIGDAGNSNRAQDPNSLNGKVLRVNSDGTIPADNPVLPGAIGRTAIYTWGNRDAQGLAFEPVTGRAFEIEPGDDTQDEINILIAGSNYGYPLLRGVAGRAGYADPAWASGSGSVATSGGEFLSGAQWGGWNGTLVVATTKEADLRRYELFDGTARQADLLFDNVWGRLRTPRLAPDGSLYLTTDNGAPDRILRITATLP
jgi:glucose/arabinose dehydrogenase